MQDYSYSVFSIVAIAIHLIMNFKLLAAKGIAHTPRVVRYRGFLVAVLAYYITDAAWGILAGLDWTRALYVDTVLYFLSLVAFVFMLSRFVTAYVGLGKWPARILLWYGYALLVFNIVLLTANCFNNCFFYFDENGKYLIGDMRYHAFSFQIAFNILIAAFVFAKAIAAKDTIRRRSMMVFLFCITIAAAIVLQVVWPLTPFTSLGCLISICFFHVFVIQDEQSSRHMTDLERALARARAAEKSRSMFFSIVSHDIRTPLNAILGYSELLQYGIKRKSERDEALNAIRSSGTTLLQLVNDVLDLAKMDSGKMTLHPEPVKISNLAEDVFATFRISAAARNIALVDNTAGIPTVMLDEHRLRQLLFNLIGNAIKFTDHGSITVDASYKGGTLELSVADTGCGIPSDMLTRILDPFVQVEDPTHAPDRASGTGLGLSICRRIVEAMDGSLAVESELGKGSKFTAVIPCEESGAEKAAPAPASEAAGMLMNLPKNVLIVDDSPVNRSVLAALLKKAGVQSIGMACDGEEAFEELQSALSAGNPYDFVFSDFWMPKMNGLELIEKLREDSRFESLTVLAVTADTEFRNDDRHKLFTRVLLKPLTFTKLVDALTKSA